MSAIIHDCPHKHIACDVFGCLNLSEYYIGEPDGPSIGFKVCKSCAESIVKNLPAELAGIAGVPVVAEPVAQIVDNTTVSPAGTTVEISADELTCAQCEKTFKSHKGLLSHIAQVHE